MSTDNFSFITTSAIHSSTISLSRIASVVTVRTSCQTGEARKLGLHECNHVPEGVLTARREHRIKPEVSRQLVSWQRQCLLQCQLVEYLKCDDVVRCVCVWSA